jgi:hypothetical protein
VFSRLPASAPWRALAGGLFADHAELIGDPSYRQTPWMKALRYMHIIDDEEKVSDALTLLLSTAQIETKSYGSAEEYLALNSLKDPVCILLDNQLDGSINLAFART